MSERQDGQPVAVLMAAGKSTRMKSDTPKVLHELPQTTVPLLIVQAIEDDICSPRHAHRIARTVIGPCHVHFLHDSYHLVHLDQERATVTRLTTQFMTDYRRILQ